MRLMVLFAIAVLHLKDIRQVEIISAANTVGLDDFIFTDTVERTLADSQDLFYLTGINPAGSV